MQGGALGVALMEEFGWGWPALEAGPTPRCWGMGWGRAVGRTAGLEAGVAWISASSPTETGMALVQSGPAAQEGGG
ncbi:hypothetical protein MGR01S_03340 [Meiothermus granaticius NBRC 107808]|uniref:Uncharacterized protein n=1 Tax=Meiothermus granaticius NBRC 107808 TaxID=1227551 RepID=A0A399FC21_9DEIN|nr:hypothetical protein Mgrana_00351 [Meiothermus granaticius NBRC 107808]GEM85709.1 hypothetical protein MGR01S_03340 [Meiothermus granaticius NBRC 107808]